jgi:hypothetical protein
VTDRTVGDGPLGGARRASGAVRQELSFATSEAATNLLTKAMRRAADGDEPRARTLVERALALPFDEHEGMDPALWSAHLLLADAISDDLESSPVDDLGWLDRAEALCDIGPTAAAEVRTCLRILHHDGYEVSAPEARRIATITRGVSWRTEPFEGVGGEPGVRDAAVLEVLAAVARHHELTGG